MRKMGIYISENVLKIKYYKVCYGKGRKCEM